MPKRAHRAALVVGGEHPGTKAVLMQTGLGRPHGVGAAVDLGGNPALSCIARFTRRCRDDEVDPELPRVVPADVHRELRQVPAAADAVEVHEGKSVFPGPTERPIGPQVGVLALVGVGQPTLVDPTVEVGRGLTCGWSGRHDRDRGVERPGLVDPEAAGHHTNSVTVDVDTLLEILGRERAGMSFGQLGQPSEDLRTHPVLPLQVHFGTLLRSRR